MAFSKLKKQQQKTKQKNNNKKTAKQTNKTLKGLKSSSQICASFDC